MYENASKEEAFHLKKIIPRACIYNSIKEQDKDLALDVILQDHREKAEGIARHLKRIMKLPGMKNIFMKAWDPLTKKMFGEKAGFKNVFYENGRNEYRMDIIQCPYCRVFSELGAPELAKYSCESDDIVYGDLPGAFPFGVNSKLTLSVSPNKMYCYSIIRLKDNLEIVKERLEREFGLELITTAPSVAYKVVLTNGEEVIVENPDKLPKPQIIAHIEEPIVKASVFTPAEFIGGLVKLCLDKRGKQKNMIYQAADRVILEYEIPLSEIVYDFYDKLKSISRGFASLDYEFDRYEKSNLVKMDILINGEPVDALSVIVHKDNSYQMGRSLVMKMRRVIPRQMYDVAIQAAIGSTVISR